MLNRTGDDQLQSNRAQTPIVLFFAALFLGVLAYPLLAGEIYVFNDFANHSLPRRDFYQRCLLNGDSPVWMPTICCGYYAHAEGETGMFHPIHWLLYRFLPLDAAFNLEFLWSYPFMFAGLYLFLRRWRLARAPSLFGAFSFTYSGYCLLHGIHLNLLQVTAHTPWLLLAIDRLLEPASTNNRRWRPWAAITLLTTSQLLLGFPQSVYLSLIAECLYVVLVLWTRRPDGVVASIGLVVSAKLLALLVSGVQVLPSLDLMRSSARGATTEAFRMFLSLHPANLIQFIGPWFFQRYVGMNVDGPKHVHEAGLYPGAIAVLLTIWVVMRVARREPLPAKGLAIGALILLVLSTWLALGRYGGLYGIVSKLPIISSLRSSCRHIVLVHLSTAVLSAIGFAGLVQAARTRELVRWRRCWPLLIPALAGWVVASYLSLALLHKLPLIPGVAPYLASLHEMWIAPIVLSAAAALMLNAVRGRAWALAGLLAFAALDQGFYALRYAATEPPMTLAEYKENITVPPTNDGYRIYMMVDNLHSVRGYDNCVGYVSDGVIDQKNKYGTGNTTALRIATVHWADARWPKLGQAPEWIEIPNPVPYARLVTDTQVSAAPADDASKVDIGSVALTSEPVEIPPAKPGTVKLVQKKPGDIILQTQNDTRQLLTLTESWHSGWRARVDGEDVPIIRVNADFMGCVVSQGSHQVRYQFEPASLALGKQVSAAGVALLALGSVFIRRLELRADKRLES